ncbi:hypothetical protein D3C73_1356490 [compost metagenome]
MAWVARLAGVSAARRREARLSLLCLGIAVHGFGVFAVGVLLRLLRGERLGRGVLGGEGFSLGFGLIQGLSLPGLVLAVLVLAGVVTRLRHAVRVVGRLRHALGVGGRLRHSVVVAHDRPFHMR